MSVSFYVSAGGVETAEEVMNVSNTNAVRLFELCGIEFEWCGDWKTGEKLKEVEGKIEFALESLNKMPELDGGIPATEDRGKGGMLIIDCGLRKGYYRDRLTTLLDAVKKAQERGEMITFSYLPFLFHSFTYME